MSNPNHEELARQALQLDPLGLVEEITRRPLGDDLEDAQLAHYLVRASHDIKRTHLSELCDTYYRMPWAEFKEVLNRAGFIEISLELVDGITDTLEEKIVVAHPERKLLGAAKSNTWESYGPLTDYNFALYAAFDGKGDDGLFDAIHRTGGSMHPVGETHWELIYYANEGLNLKLKQFDELGIKFCDWPKFAGQKSWLPEIPNDAPGWVKDFTGFSNT